MWIDWLPEESVHNMSQLWCDITSIFNSENNLKGVNFMTTTHDYFSCYYYNFLIAR